MANAGDVNADGRLDALVGARNASHNGRAYSGSAYVVFGQAATTAIDLDALGTEGYLIDGAAAVDLAGISVASAGDVNGDGRPDALGARNASHNGRAYSGSAYVVSGQAATTAIDLDALGVQGYLIDGAAANDQTGASVASAGDVGGGASPDLLVGAPFTDNNARADSGSAYTLLSPPCS